MARSMPFIAVVVQSRLRRLTVALCTRFDFAAGFRVILYSAEASSMVADT
jgi:hypothetical protein